MIKLLFVINDLGGGGAEKVLVNLVNRMDKTKFDITILTIFSGGINEQFLSNEVRLITIFPFTFPGNRFIFRLFSPNTLHKLMIKDYYDLEIAFLEGSAARIVSGSSKPNTKKVSWIHITQNTPKVASLAFRNVKEAENCYKTFNRIVAVSKLVAQDFQKLFPSSDRVDILYNPQCPDRILSMSLEKLDNSNLFKKDTFKIIGIGKLIPKKGFDKLIQLTKKLIDDGYNVETFILGCGKGEARLKKMISELQLTNSISILGYQANPYPFISRADLFICTSWFEGYSTAAVESLILGVPVVSTPVSGIREMLGTWANEVVSPDFTLESLYHTTKNIIGNRQLYDAYKKSIPEISLKFSDKNTINKIESFLIDLYSSNE